MKRLLLAILPLLILSPNADATISASSVFENRVAGSDTNGGGFVPGGTGTDMSLFPNKNAASCTNCQSSTINISTTDAVAAGSTTIVSATASFQCSGANDLRNNIIYIQGGTGSITAIRKQVISCTNATTIVVDSSTGLTAGTGVTMNIGGALFSLGTVCASMVAGNTAFFLQAGSAFLITSATQNVTGGTCGSVSSANIIGYTTTRTLGNTDATWPTLQHNVSTATAFSNSVMVHNFIVDCNSQTSSKAFGNASVMNVEQENCNVANSGTVTYFNLIAIGNSAAVVVSGITCISCTFHANTATPFTSGNCDTCLSDNNSGASTDGFACTSTCSISNSTAVSNGRHGFNGSSSAAKTWVNILAVSNTGTGILLATIANSTTALIGYAAISNGTNLNIDPTVPAQSNISLSVSPFVGAPNYSLNNTATGGAALRGAGLPTALGASGATPTFQDIGASQHQSVGGVAGSAYVQ